MSTRLLLAAFVITAFARTAVAQAPAVDAKAGAMVKCKDGTSSKGARGACSGHGGIDRSAGTAPAAPSAAAPESKGTSAPTAAGDTVRCKDGTTSKGGRGACSGHGGIDHSGGGQAAGNGEKIAPAAASGSTHAAPAAPAPANDNAGGTPTARCKDGTMSFSKHHQGACSHHGGVAQWLDGTK